MSKLRLAWGQKSKRFFYWIILFKSIWNSKLVNLCFIRVCFPVPVDTLSITTMIILYRWATVSAFTLLGCLCPRPSWILQIAWWRHQMETVSALLAICAGNSPVTGEFPSQRPVTRSFAVFFDLHPNKQLSKQWWGWWFETPPSPLWRHRNGIVTMDLPHNRYTPNYGYSEMVSRATRCVWCQDYLASYMVVYLKKSFETAVGLQVWHC